MNVNGKRVIVCDDDHDDKISKIKKQIKNIIRSCELYFKIYISSSHNINKNYILNLQGCKRRLESGETLFIFYFVIIRLFARMYAFFLWSHPSFKIWKSTMAAFPPVIELAKRASPHDRAVWLGLDPDE